MYIFLCIFIIKRGSSYLNSVLFLLLNTFMASKHKSVHELRNMNTTAFMAGVSGGTEVDSDTSQSTSTITPIVTSQIVVAYKLNGRNFIP